MEGTSFGMRWAEALDSASGTHLGHTIEDCPPPKGLRYCINSPYLLLVPGERNLREW